MAESKKRPNDSDSSSSEVDEAAAVKFSDQLATLLKKHVPEVDVSADVTDLLDGIGGNDVCRILNKYPKLFDNDFNNLPVHHLHDPDFQQLRKDLRMLVIACKTFMSARELLDEHVTNFQYDANKVAKKAKK